MFSEEKRQLVHILLLFLAFLLKYTPRWQAVILLLVLLAMTLIFVPRMKLKNYFYRYTENKYSQGAVLYFLALLILVLVFPLYIVAVSWAILALGDGAATLIGKNLKCRELPWNRSKSFAGSAAFVVFGTFGAVVLMKWMIPDLSLYICLVAALKTTVVAAIVESMPLKINDNVSVAFTSAIVMYLLKIV